MSSESIESLQGRLREQAAAQSHLTRLAQLRALFEADAACIAAVLVGSFAKGSGNRLSDLDLVAFTTRGGAQSFSERADRVLATHDLLHCYSGHHGTSGCFRKYVYLDFSSCELHVADEAAPFRLFRPYLSVWDPSGFLPGREVGGPAPKHEDFEPYPHGDDGLIWELVDCVKWIKQGRVQLAKNYLRKLGAKLRADNEAVGSGYAMNSIRPQYHLRKTSKGIDAFDVSRLIELSKDLPIRMIDPSALAELDEDHWYFHTTDRPTPRSIVEHFRHIRACDLRHPIILDQRGRVMDGMHRVCKAILEGVDRIPAVQFVADPAPDFIDCNPEELPY